MESKDTSWEVKADVPEDKELSQYGMILLLMGPPVSSFGFSMDVIESKNSAAVILDIASLLMAMSESKGDFELVAGLGETLNWRESASCGQSNRATRAPPWPRESGYNWGLWYSSPSNSFKESGRVSDSYCAGWSGFCKTL